MRGYNQAELLAQRIGRVMETPVSTHVLRRTKSTQPQARAKDATQRRQNVAGAFGVPKRQLGGACVLLIDDVATTGSTMDACAAALKQANARSVYGLAFARED
jgi:predicted amidophosphoribosyltransferase